jgi:hypothetical protein
MRCQSCGTNIPPEWVYVINSNTCPACGNSIMNEASKQLMEELAEAMDKMPHDPQGVAGWLLSNYRFQKIGEGKPVEKFHRKTSNSDITSENSSEISDFVKRNNAEGLVEKSNALAEKFKKQKNNKFAQLVEQITKVDDPYGDDDDSSSIKEVNFVDDEDRQAYEAFKAEGLDPFGENSEKLNNINELSQILNSKNKEEVLSDIEVALSQSEEGRRVLNIERMRKIKAQDSISGGSSGSFKRC